VRSDEADGLFVCERYVVRPFRDMLTANVNTSHAVIAVLWAGCTRPSKFCGDRPQIVAESDLSLPSPQRTGIQSELLGRRTVSTGRPGDVSRIPRMTRLVSPVFDLPDVLRR